MGVYDHGNSSSKEQLDVPATSNSDASSKSFAAKMSKNKQKFMMLQRQH
jgi:hypothetical protein